MQFEDLMIVAVETKRQSDFNRHFANRRVFGFKDERVTSRIL